MLANFFGKSKPVNFILIIVLFLFYYVFNFFLVEEPQVYLDSFLDFLLVFPLFLGIFFLFNFVIYKNNLTKDDSYAFLLFVIGLGFLEIVVLDYKALLTYVLLFLFLRRVYSLRTLKTIYQKLFDAGFWLGVLLLISPYFLGYFLLLYAASFFFVKITIRTVLIPVLGIITPLFLSFSYFLWNADLASFYEIFNVVFVVDFRFYTTSYYEILTTLFLFFVLISIVFRTGKILSVSNRFKKSWLLLILHLVIAILFVGFKSEKDGSELISFLIPATILISNWMFSVKKKIIVTIVLAIFLVFSFAIHFIV